MTNPYVCPHGISPKECAICTYTSEKGRPIVFPNQPQNRLTIGDGLRFGVGMILASVLGYVFLIVGLLLWAELKKRGM